jgi:type IV pilus assembly protein PilW
MIAITTRQHRRPERGFSLIEIMVGIVIGLIAVLVIYQVFAAAEGIKRNTTSVGDAQQNGLLSSFMLGIELANAGNGVASSAQELGACPSSLNFASTWRPIPLLIVDGGADDTPDSFMVNYSVANVAIAPAPFYVVGLGAVAADAPYPVQSPMGFQVNDLIVAARGFPAAVGCAASKVTGVSAPDGNGVVTITHTNPGVAASFDDPAVLLNLGPAANAQKIRYEVTAAGVLRSTALLKTDGTLNDDTSPPPNPLASNVVNMKLQYGIVPAVPPNGPIQWLSAAATPWTPLELTSTIAGPNLIAQLKTLKAVRIGIVVRGEQWDKEGPDVPWSLFGGHLGGGYEGTFPSAGGNFRYRTYETVIPVRNELWNAF